MKQLEKLILIDLTKHALNTGEFVRALRNEKYFFGMHYLPVYFANNYPDASIDELNEACMRLEANGFVEFSPTVYIKLKAQGANYCAISYNITIDTH